MKYRLIASDIDGTLTNIWNKVSDRNREVLRKLVDRGVAFMIATGRSYGSAEGIIRALDIPCYACLVNGAMIAQYPEKKLIHTNYLSVVEKDLLLEKIHEAGVHVVSYSGFERGDKVYYTDSYHQSPILSAIVASTTERQIKVSDLRRDVDHPVPVISCVGTEQEIDALLVALEPYRGQFNILKLKEHYRPGYFWVMITRKEADKVRGIQYVANYLGVSQSEVIAAGDDFNDLEMIKYAGLGIAMENGIPEIKAVADMIAPPCSEDGLASALEEIFLNDIV